MISEELYQPKKGVPSSELWGVEWHGPEQDDRLTLIIITTCPPTVPKFPLQSLVHRPT